MFTYKPKNKKIKTMQASGHLITEGGFESLTKIPELDQLVEANILEREEQDLDKLKAIAEQEKREAQEAKAKAEKLQKEADEAKTLAEKEEKEALEASEQLQEAETSKPRRRRRSKKKPSSEE